FCTSAVMAPFETIRSSETSDMVAPSGLRVSCASRSKRASVVLNSLRSLAFSAFSIRVAQESSRSQIRNSRWAPSDSCAGSTGRNACPRAPFGDRAFRLTVASMVGVSPKLNGNGSDAGSAADIQCLPGDEVGIRRTEETDGARDVVGRAEAAERDRLRQLFRAFGFRRHHALEHLGISDWAGGHDVDGDAVWCKLQRPGPRHAD